MAQNNVVVGTNPGDGTGDPIRDAFIKINSNFDEIYTSYIANGAITVGNSSVNTVISNTGGLRTGNTTSNLVANSSTVRLGNSSVNTILTSAALTVGNSVINSSALYVGNSTVNTTHSVTTFQISNSTSNVTIGAGSLFIGNSSVNASANSSRITISSANITSNTGLTLGSSTDAANGYTFLPNGFKLNWGWVSTNSSAGTIVFTPAFTTNAYSVTVSSNSAVATYQSAVISWTKDSSQVRTANATSTNVYWMAIGK